MYRDGRSEICFADEKSRWSKTPARPSTTTYQARGSNLTGNRSVGLYRHIGRGSVHAYAGRIIDRRVHPERFTRGVDGRLELCTSIPGYGSHAGGQGHGSKMVAMATARPHTRAEQRGESRTPTTPGVSEPIRTMETTGYGGVNRKMEREATAAKSKQTGRSEKTGTDNDKRVSRAIRLIRRGAISRQEEHWKVRG